MVKKDVHFLMKNNQVQQPFIPTDGLELYYDVKGKKNTDNYKSTLLDMSGNGRHGTLNNFAYEGVSGFTGTTDGGLLLDDVDDKIVRPAITGIEYTSASRNLVSTPNNNVASIGASYRYGVEENSTYTISFTKSRINAIPITNNRVNILTYIKIGGTQTAINTTAKSTNPTLVYGTPVRLFATFTIPSGATSIDVDFGNNNSDINTNTLVSDIQLEKGSVATAYTPYIPLPIMTYQMNGNILSFEKDGTVKRTTKDANGNEVVVSRKGINLIRNGNFTNEMNYWTSTSLVTMKVYDESAYITPRAQWGGIRPIENFSLSINEKYYISSEMKTTDNSARIYMINGVNNKQTATHSGSGEYEKLDLYYEYSYPTSVLNYISPQTSRTSDFRAIEVRNIQVINLTDAYGAGNEPTLAYIQAHPEEFAWTPNPNDLIETVEIKNNLVGDLENLQGNDFEQHEDGVITYTNEAEEGSVVRVDIDGISDQPFRFRNATGEQVVITEHDQTDEDAIKKVEFQGNSVQLVDKYREVSGTSLVIAPELHYKNVADKLVIGGNTTQYTESSNVVTDGLQMWLSGRNFSNSPATTVWKDLTGVNNGTASGFAFTSASGSDGNGGVVFDGVNDYIGTAFTVLPEFFTVEVRSTLKSIPDLYGQSVLYGSRNASWNTIDTGIELVINNNGGTATFHIGDGMSLFSLSIPTGTGFNAVHTYTVTKTLSGFNMYMDGVLKASKAFGKTIGKLNLSMSIKLNGRGNGGQGASTTIPFARIYNRALSDAEILQNYNAGVTIPIPNIAMPQEVKHVTSGSKVLVHGKNIMNIVTTTPYNTPSVVRDGEWYVANNGLYGGIIFDKYPTQSGKIYTISFTYKSTNNGGHYTITNVLGSALKGLKYGSNTNLSLIADGVERRKSITFTANATEELTISLLRSGDSGSVSYKDIQVEEGTSATAYEPFKDYQETTIPVTLKSIG